MTRIDPAALRGTIDQLFAERGAREERVAVHRAASANVLFFPPPGSDLRSVEALLEIFFVMRPSRVFLLLAEEEREGPAIDLHVAARCYPRGKGEEVCAELVTMRVQPSAWSALPSVLRSSLLPAMPTELFLVGLNNIPPLAGNLLGLADVVYLESALFTEARGTLEALTKERHLQVIDLTWLSLAPWREAIREVFERPALATIADQVREVQVAAGSGLGQQEGALLLGWCRSKLVPRDGEVSPVMKLVAAGNAGVESVRFLWSGGSIALRHGEGPHGVLLETQGVVGAEEFRSTREVSPTHREGLLSRLFLLGESMQNYSRALLESHHFVRG